MLKAVDMDLHKHRVLVTHPAQVTHPRLTRFQVPLDLLDLKAHKAHKAHKHLLVTQALQAHKVLLETTLLPGPQGYQVQQVYLEQMVHQAHKVHQAHQGYLAIKEIMGGLVVKDPLVHQEMSALLDP